MSKYKVGDKIVMEITKIFSDNFGTKDCIVKGFTRCGENCLSEHSEPLSTYTLPLEDKIHKQAEEITKLLAKNKELKKDLEYYHTGQNEAWELARKIVLNNGYSDYDLNEIFNCYGSHQVLENYTYPEAAAKVAEWEKAKEIKAGDIVESNNDNGERIVVIDVWSSFDGLHFEGISSNKTLVIDASAKYYTKSGHHIGIDSFLKQIRGEEK